MQEFSENGDAVPPKIVARSYRATQLRYVINIPLSSLKQSSPFSRHFSRRTFYDSLEVLLRIIRESFWCNRLIHMQILGYDLHIYRRFWNSLRFFVIFWRALRKWGCVVCGIYGILWLIFKLWKCWMILSGIFMRFFASCQRAFRNRDSSAALCIFSINCEILDFYIIRKIE